MTVLSFTSIELVSTPRVQALGNTQRVYCAAKETGKRLANTLVSLLNTDC